MQKYIRNSKIVFRTLDDELILINNELDTIFNLNPIGAAVWTFLEEPRSAEEIINTLVLAFPDKNEDEIRSDILHLLDQFLDKELLFTYT